MFYALLEKSLQCGKSAILLWKKFGIICSYTTHAKKKLEKMVESIWKKNSEK